MAAVGPLLRRHREAAGLTQEELAERAGVSARTVSDIERGLRSRLYPDTAERLATALCLADPEFTDFVSAARGRLAFEPRRSGIPCPITGLVGRDAELADVTGALGSGRRLVTITGLGGVGKTRLALASAEWAERIFANRVHFVAVPVGHPPELFAGLVSSAIGASDQPEALATYLRGRPTLVIADSFEHALPATATLHEMLLAIPDLHMLVTSRARLQITGEYEVALTPLELPDWSDPAWDRAASVRLFLARARDVHADLGRDPGAVVEICRRLSGLPLALELAAARLRHLPLGVLRDRLRDGLVDLVQQQPSGHGTANPVQETLSWTVDSLQPDEARVLRACAQFPGGWRLDALELLFHGGTALGAITVLVDMGLAYLDRSPADVTGIVRWQMLDVVREFVLGATHNEQDAAWERAYQSFYRDLLATARANLGREREWFRLLEAEEANVRKALTLAADAGDAEELLRLANGMWFYWQAQGALVEGRHWLELGLRLDPPAAAETRVTALWGVAMLAHHQADDRVAEQCAEELHALGTLRRDDAALRHATTIRGMVAIARQDGDQGVTLFHEALRLARGIGDEWILATSLLNLGLGLLSEGSTDDARTALAEALARYERLHDERFHARCLGYLGLASLLDGDPERARALFVDALRVFHRLAEPGGTAEALTGLAAVDAKAGRPAHAALLAGAAERLRESFAARQLPLDQRTTERYLAAARAELGEQKWEDAWGAGQQLNLDEAVARALGMEARARSRVGDNHP